MFFDGQQAGTFAYTRQAEQRVGFRGHLNPVWIDNIVLETADGRRVVENFDPQSGMILRPLIMATVVLSGLGLLLLATAALKAPGRSIAFVFLTTSLTLLVIVGVFLVFIRSRAGWYPKLDQALVQKEAYFRKGEAEQVLNELNAEIERAPTRRKRRLLFVGTSQTWGAGALREQDAFVNRIEALLNKRFEKRRFACANLGVSSGRARTLLPLLRAIQREFRPYLVVIDLGSNDRASKDFQSKLHQMIKFVLENNSMPVLVKEANSPLAVDEGLRAKHLEIEALGISTGFR